MPLLLSDAEEDLYRSIAADAYRSANGNRVRARRLFKADSRIVSLDPATILFIVQIAYRLWTIWRSMNVIDPDLAVRSDEPRFGSQA